MESPKGNWLILRTGYTLTGHTWSRWFAYPQGDTFAEGAGYEIDYLSKAALDNHFNHLGTIILDEVKRQEAIWPISGRIAGNAGN